jgi:hypothetical protein
MTAPMIARPATLARLLTLALAATLGCAAPAAARPAATATATARIHVLRLRPGDDLARSLDAFAREHDLQAAVVVACAGSLTTAAIRFADRPEATTLQGKREIVSLTGTLSAASGSHLHIAVADGEGTTLGGHLMPGAKVYTTAEIAVAELVGVRFEREVDPTFGYRELVVRPAR